MQVARVEGFEQKRKKKERELIDIDNRGDYRGGLDMEESIEGINCDGNKI